MDCLSQYYFAVPPEQMIYTHWPQDHQWQLLDKPVNLSDIECLISPHAGVFALGISAVTCCEEKELKADIPGPVIHVELKSPSSLQLNVHLTSLATPESSDLQKPCGEDRNTYIHKEGEEEDSRAHIYVLCPAEGKYCLHIFAQPNLSDPPMFCFSYYVMNYIPGNEYCDCPVIHRIAAAAFKFQLLSWNTPQLPFIAKNESGKLDVTFKVAPNIKLHHYIMPGKDVSNLSLSQALYYYTSVTRHKADPQCCLMQVLFPEKGWWNVYIWCSLDAAPDGSTSGYTLVANIRMYACIGISGQTFPQITSPVITFDNADPISIHDGEVLEVPFNYSDADTLNAYITKSTTAQLLTDFAIVERLKCNKYLLHAVLPEPGKWEICVVGKKTSDSTTDVMVFRLFADVKKGLNNTVFPYLFSTPATELGIRLADSKPVTYASNGSSFSFAFQAPLSLEFQHGIQLMPDQDAPSKAPNTDIIDFCTYLCYPSKTCELHTVHSLFPQPGLWSVTVYARKGSSGAFYQVISVNNLEISTVAQSTMCYPRLNPSFHGITIPSDCLPCPSVIEQPEFRLPFSAPRQSHFSCSMSLDVSEENTYDNAFVHNVDESKYLLHVVFPKPGTWLIHVSAVLGSADKQETKLVFQLKLKAVGFQPDLAFPELFEPFYTTFNMRIADTHLPLLRRVKKVPSTLHISFFCPSDVLLWHLAQVNEVVHEAATQIPPSAEPGKHELVIDFNKTGRWVITLYAQLASAENKADWTPVLRHVVTVGRSSSTQTQ